MDEQTLQHWGALHRRYVLGEPLSVAEQAAYEAGCQKLDAEEILHDDLPRQQEMQARIEAVMDTQQRLLEQENTLAARIAALESRLNEWVHLQHSPRN